MNKKLLFVNSDLARIYKDPTDLYTYLRVLRVVIALQNILFFEKVSKKSHPTHACMHAASYNKTCVRFSTTTSDEHNNFALSYNKTCVRFSTTTT